MKTTATTRPMTKSAPAVRPFPGTDDRGMEQRRTDGSDLRRELAPGDPAPDHSTPHTVAERLLKKGAPTPR